MTIRKNMLKRIVLLALCFAMILCTAACGKNKDEAIVPSEKKVAILVAPQTQYPEDYAAAMAVQKEYPDSVIVKEYADSRTLKAGDGEIITLSEQIAADSTVGAIIYARATQFTDDAIYRAKSVNSQIVTVAIEPEDNIEHVADVATLVLTCDWNAAAADMVNAAKNAGAEYFVFFSVLRHTESKLVLKEADAFRAACETAGIRFCSANGADPIAAEGIPHAEKVIREQLGQLELNKEISGNNVALFSTDSSVQSALVELAESKGMIYLSPNFPSAYGGMDTHFDVAAPKKITDTDTHVSDLKKAVKGAEGRYAVYNYSLMSDTVNAAVYCAFDFLNGTTNNGNLSDRIALRYAQASDEKIVPVPYDSHISNVWCGYKESAYTVIKK